MELKLIAKRNQFSFSYTVEEAYRWISKLFAEMQKHRTIGKTISITSALAILTASKTTYCDDLPGLPFGPPNNDHQILFSDGFEAILTPTGAIIEGTSDGLVPRWDGGITEPPDGFEPTEHHINPFPADNVMLTIDSSNLDQFEELLSDGHLKLFNNSPDYEIKLYESRRTASYPENVYAATLQNEESAILLDNQAGIADAEVGFPFRKPSNGEEAIWNHLLRYKGIKIRRRDDQFTMHATGDINVLPIRQQIKIDYQDPQSDTSVNEFSGPMLFEQVLLNPNEANDAFLFRESLDKNNLDRFSWIFNAELRRVRRAPEYVYDAPVWAGEILVDMLDMFSGPVDLYEWELHGRRLLIVPYNAYTLHSGTIGPTEILQDHFINPMIARYEVHRVLMVEASLKDAFSHEFPSRIFYLDEDSYQILLAEHYDEFGELSVFSEAHPINYYQVPTVLPTLEVYYDFINQRYSVRGLDNQFDPYEFEIPENEECLTPQRLRVCGRSGG